MDEPSHQRARIRVLPDMVANQIAAGEVIERPAAVAKELLENSLDAGARRVAIEFRHGGKSLIRVEDDGSGMPPDEALMALEPHATSKLRTAEDLHTLATMGFRGEALPSIASVSRFLLQTRPPEAVEGSEVLVHAGKLIHQRACGMPRGTRIEVTQLFNSVPARRKFLKADATEAAHLIQLVRLHAAANPQTAFTLKEGNKLLINTPPCADPLERVAEIWGRELAEALVELPPVEGEDGMRLHGLIGPPGLGRASKRELITIVNRRPVESRALGYAVIEAYHTHLPKGRYPVAFLWLELDPAAVDVNIHPAKREIRFRNETGVRQFVLNQILPLLERVSRPGVGAVGLTRSAETAGVEPRPMAPPPPPAPVPPTFRPRTHPGTISDEFRRRYLTDENPSAGKPPQPSPPKEGPCAEVLPKPTQPDATTPLPATAPEPSLPVAEAAAPWRFVGVAVGYLLYEAPRGLVAVNPRAAQERILFERIRAAFAGAKSLRQRMLFPAVFEFEPVTAAALHEWGDFLAAAGLTLEPFGRTTYRLTDYPEWLPEAEVEPLVQELASCIREGAISPRRLDPAREWFARTAAKRTAQHSANQPEDPESLLDQLLRCQQPLSDPQGRPTLVEWSHRDLAKRFGLA